MAFPVVRVCVTEVSLVQSIFLCTQDSSYCCNLCVLNITCGQIFTVLSIWGILSSTRQYVYYNRLADLLPAPSMSAPPFSGDSVAILAVASGPSTSFSNKIAVAVAHALHQSVPSFVAAFRTENLTACFPAWLFPISSVIF